MYNNVPQRELGLELLRDRLRNTSAARQEWCMVFCEYLDRLAKKD